MGAGTVIRGWQRGQMADAQSIEPERVEAHGNTAAEGAAGRRIFGRRLNLTTFSAFSIIPYRWYMVSTMTGTLGYQMQGVALGWLVYLLTGSAVHLGLITTIQAVGETVMCPFAGVIADRVERRNYVIRVRTITVVVAVVLAVLVILNRITYWELAVAALFFGIAFGLNGPARTALLAQIVDRDRLINAVSLFSGGQNLMRIVGPAAAGFLIGVIGVQGIYVILAFCYLIVILTMFPIPPQPIAPHTGRRDVTGDLSDGISYSYQNPAVFGLLLLGTIPLFFAMPYISLLPIFAERVWNVGASGFGILSAAPGVGGFIGALAVASVSRYPRKGRLMIGGTILYGLMLAAFALSPSFVLGAICLTLSGAAGVAYSATVSSLVQSIIPNEMRGRVMSFYQMSYGISGLSALPAGAIAAWAGAPITIAACGVLTAISAVAILRLRPILATL